MIFKQLRLVIAVVWLSTGLSVSLIALALESLECKKWERASQQWHEHALKFYEAYTNQTQQSHHQQMPLKTDLSITELIVSNITVISRRLLEDEAAIQFQQSQLDKLITPTTNQNRKRNEN